MLVQIGMIDKSILQLEIQEEFSIFVERVAKNRFFTLLIEQGEDVSINTDNILYIKEATEPIQLNREPETNVATMKVEKQKVFGSNDTTRCPDCGGYTPDEEYKQWVVWCVKNINN